MGGKRLLPEIQTFPARSADRMKTALLIAALALLVIAPLVATPVAADHGGWNCRTTAGHQVCTARTLNWTDDCFMRVDGQYWCYQ